MSFSHICNPDVRDLLSFPTRRSSDLSQSYLSLMLIFLALVPPILLTQQWSVIGWAVEGVLIYLWALEKNRSEEHTSELQSRENLVCRLLLEKKKKSDKTRILGNTQEH